MKISIIVPVLDEEAIIAHFLRHLRGDAPQCELVVVDGGSADRTFEIAKTLSDVALVSARGRGAQMNAGAAAATGDVFWFVHADSTIGAGMPDEIIAALRNPEIVGGCFRLRIDSPRSVYAIRDLVANAIIDCGGIALGDRALFCRRELFLKIGGYRDVPVLEDAGLFCALRRCGRMVQVRNEIRTSARRYETLGAAQTMLFYAFVMLLFSARVPISKLHRLVRWYVQRRTT